MKMRCKSQSNWFELKNVFQCSMFRDSGDCKENTSGVQNYYFNLITDLPILPIGQEWRGTVIIEIEVLIAKCENWPLNTMKLSCLKFFFACVFICGFRALKLKICQFRTDSLAVLAWKHQKCYENAFLRRDWTDCKTILFPEWTEYQKE